MKEYSKEAYFFVHILVVGLHIPIPLKVYDG